MKPSEFLKIASDFGYSQQVEWAKEAASKSTWKSPQSRGGTRPLRVDTMLRKEKDGTLTKLAPKPREEEKEAALSQPGGADYSEPERDPGSAKPPASPTKIPSREDVAGGVRREDGRDFATTLPGPGTFLNDTGPQPAYIKTGNLLSRVLTDEHAADVAGLAPMVAAGVDRLQGELRGQGSEGIVGEKAHTATDLAGLGVMALPHLRNLAAGGPSKGLGKYLYPAAVVGGLGALAVPTADVLQAKLRSAPGEDEGKKQLLSHRTHDLMETAGYGLFGGLSVADAIKNRSALDAAHAAGYGLLAAPHVEGLIKKHDEPKIFSGATRAATDLLGTGTLLGAGLAHTGHSPHGPATSAGRLMLPGG